MASRPNIKRRSAGGGFGGLLARLFAVDGYSWDAEGGDVPLSPMDPRLWGAGDLTTHAGQRVSPDSMHQLDTVAAILDRLGGSISTLPFMVFKRGADGAGTPAPEHPLHTLLHKRPNARQTAQEFRDEQQRHLASWRNAYAEIVEDPTTGAPVGSLEPIHPERIIKIERLASGALRYLVRDLAPDGQIGGGATWIAGDRMWHIRKAPLTADGLRGKYVWETNKEVIGRAQAVEAYGASFFANGGSGGFFKHPGTFKTKDDEEQFLERMKAMRSGRNRFKDQLLLYGIDYVPPTNKNDEAQFLETLKEMAIKLCRLWNMPPHMVGIQDNATKSNVEQQSIEFVIYCLAPYLTAWEQAIERDLLIGDDQAAYYVQFNVAGLLRGDFKTRWGAYAQGRQWGWLCVNDILRLENMPTIGPQGDQYLVPLNTTPANATAQPGFDAPPPADVDPEDDDDNQDPRETNPK